MQLMIPLFLKLEFFFKIPFILGGIQCVKGTYHVQYLSLSDIQFRLSSSGLTLGHVSMSQQVDYIHR